jgi:hypothetical protein
MSATLRGLLRCRPGSIPALNSWDKLVACMWSHMHAPAHVHLVLSCCQSSSNSFPDSPSKGWKLSPAGFDGHQYESHLCTKRMLFGASACDLRCSLPKDMLRSTCLASGWPEIQRCAYAPGFESQSAQSHPASFHTSSWAGCELGFWWFPLYELHVYFSTGSEAEALSEHGIVAE